MSASNVNKKLDNDSGYLMGLGLIEFIGNTVAQAFAYQTRLDELDLERKRIAEEAALRHKMVESSLAAELAEIDHARTVVREKLALAASNFDQSHLERKQIIGLMQQLTDMLNDAQLSSAEKQLAVQQLEIYSTVIIELTKQNSLSLQKLLNLPQLHCSRTNPRSFLQSDVIDHA